MQTMKTGFSATPNQIRAAEQLFLAEAIELTVRPTVLAYRQAIVERLQPRTAACWKEDGLDRIITDPDQMYLAEDGVFEMYDAECQKARDAAGLKVSHPDKCPLLEARAAVTTAKNALIEAMRPVADITAHALLCAGLDQYDQYVLQASRLLAPFVRDAEEIAQTAVCEGSVA